jgi:hypothetical protein
MGQDDTPARREAWVGHLKARLRKAPSHSQTWQDCADVGRRKCSVDDYTKLLEASVWLCEIGMPPEGVQNHWNANMPISARSNCRRLHYPWPISSDE